MPKLSNFIVLLDNPQAVYYAGQVLSGHVQLTLSEPMKMKAIRLHMHGKSKVRWTERHGKTSHSYTNEEVYFDYILILYGKGPQEGGDPVIHPAGDYKYHFNYQIPITCPSSFESTIGNVRYKLKAIIDKPWKFDPETITMFTVINMLDLNKEPTALAVAQTNGSKTLCCLCCASGPITAQVRLDRMGFVPGQNVLISAEVENHCDREVTSYAELIQVIIYHATTKSKTESRTLTQVYQRAIPPGDSHNWVNVALAVPPVAPSRLEGCNIIDIQYNVKFVVDPTGPSLSLKLPLGIIVGSIPHMATVGAGAPTQAPGETTFSTPQAAYADLPPPSYAECAFGKANTSDEFGSHTTGKNDFAPVYTYYNWDPFKK